MLEHGKRTHWRLFLIFSLPAAVWLLSAAMAWAQAEPENQLRDPDPKVRARAAKQLGDNGNPAYLPALAGLIKDSDEKVRLAVVKSLVQLGTPASLPPLCETTSDALPEIRYRAIDGIVNFYLPGYVGAGVSGLFHNAEQKVQGMFSDVDEAVVDADTKLDPQVVQTLSQLVTGAPDMETRVRAARALGILRAKDAVPALLQASFGKNTDVTFEVLRAFQKIKDTSVGPRIIFLLHYPQKDIEERAAETLGVLRTEEAVPDLRALLRSTGDTNVRAAALNALAFMPTADTGALFRDNMNDKQASLRIPAVLGLGRLKDPADDDQLVAAWSTEHDAGVRLALAFALVDHGKMGEYLDALVSSLPSRIHGGEARPYLIELAREAAVRQALYPKIYSPNADIRKNLCMVLAASGDSSSISYLQVLLKDHDPDVVAEASRAIRILQSRGM